MVTKKKIAVLGIPFFFILPWLGFIISLFNIKAKSSAFVYIATAVIFGYSFSFLNESADSFRYALSFQDFDTSLNYEKIIALYKEGELRDVYKLLLFYISSIFSHNPKVLFAIAGGFFGYFSYQNMMILRNEMNIRIDIFTFIISISFFIHCSFANINGLRFTTGAMVLFFSIYNLFIKENKKYLLGVLVLPLFHYGFVLFVLVILFYLIFKKFMYTNKEVNVILFYSFIVTFFLSWILGTNSISLDFFLKSSLISGEIGNRLEYLNSDDTASFVNQRAANSLFLSVQKYFDIGIKIYVFIMIVYFNKLIKKIKGNKIEFTKFLAFIMFFYSFAFIALSFPVGERFMFIAHLFLFVFMGKVYKYYKNVTYKKLILFSIPFFSFNIVFIIFFLPILILSTTFWYGNFFWILLEGLGFKI